MGGGGTRKERSIVPSVVAQISQSRTNSGRRGCSALTLEPCLHKSGREVSVTDCELRQRSLLLTQKVRVIQRTSKNEPGYRVQVRGEGLASQPHRLQRDGAASGEGIQHARRTAVKRLANLLAEVIYLREVLPPPAKDSPVGFLARGVLHAIFAFLGHETASHALPEPPPRLFAPRIAQEGG